MIHLRPLREENGERERFRKLFEEKGDGLVGRAHERRGNLPDGPMAADAMEEEPGAHHDLSEPAGAPAVADAMEQELRDAAPSEEVGAQPPEYDRRRRR